jgi:YfiH family protein
MTTACSVASSAPLQSDLLGAFPGVRHAITHRVAGMGQADGNIGFSAPRDRVDAWEMRQRWCAAVGLRAEHLVTLGQVHGHVAHMAMATHAGWGAKPGSRQIGHGDALVTDAAGPVLLTLHADCQPVLFVDPARHGHGPAVAVAHAGWRGTVADVVGSTLASMRQRCGTRVGDVHVYLGPAIGPCCYEVGDEVAAAWQDMAGSDTAVALAERDGSRWFSLTAGNAWLLERAGVLPAHIERSPICTRCQGEQWFSHRGQGPHTGRFGAMIALGG